MDKKLSRKRRLKRTREHIKRLCCVRLSVFRTPKHIYAQIIAAEGGAVLASASTVDKQLRSQLEATGNVAAAKEVGKAIAERARSVGVLRVAFDRSGFKYHGRVKALADAAREGGLEF